MMVFISAWLIVTKTKKEGWVLLTALGLGIVWPLLFLLCCWLCIYWKFGSVKKLLGTSGTSGTSGTQLADNRATSLTHQGTRTISERPRLLEKISPTLFDKLKDTRSCSICCEKITISQYSYVLKSDERNHYHPVSHATSDVPHDRHVPHDRQPDICVTDPVSHGTSHVPHDRQPDICVTVCGHVFHYICLDRWFSTNRMTCPECRQNQTMDKCNVIFQYASDTDSGINMENRKLNKTNPESTVVNINMENSIISSSTRTRSSTNDPTLQRDSSPYSDEHGANAVPDEIYTITTVTATNDVPGTHAGGCIQSYPKKKESLPQVHNSEHPLSRSSKRYDLDPGTSDNLTLQSATASSIQVHFVHQENKVKPVATIMYPIGRRQ